VRERRKGLSWMMLVILLLAFTAIGTFDLDMASGEVLPEIYVDPPTSTAAPTETFAVDINVVNIMADASLYGWEFTIGFNTTILDAIGVVEGSFLKDTGYSTFFSKKIDNTAGTVKALVTITQFPYPPQGAVGAGTLCNITFQVKDIGNTTLHFEDTELQTLVGTPPSDPYPIPHTAEDGYFDNLPPTTQYTLTVNVVGNGSVSKSPDQATYASGTVVTLTATADAGWTFSGWSGDLTGSTNPDTITMDGDKTVTATFTEVTEEYDLTIAVDGVGGTTDPVPGVYTHAEGANVPVTAVPDEGYVLDHWELDTVDVGTDNPYTVTMDANHSLTAFFTVSKTVISVEPPTSTAGVGETFTVNLHCQHNHN